MGETSTQSPDPELPDPPCPDPTRSTWLLTALGSFGRRSIQVEQYEELRGLAIAQRAEIERLRGVLVSHHLLARSSVSLTAVVAEKERYRAALEKIAEYGRPEGRARVAARGIFVVASVVAIAEEALKEER